MESCMVKSHSDPNTIYCVLIRDDGSMHCTCDGHRYRGMCAHLAEGLRIISGRKAAHSAAMMLPSLAARIERLAGKVDGTDMDQEAWALIEEISSRINSLEARISRRKRTTLGMQVSIPPLVEA